MTEAEQAQRVLCEVLAMAGYPVTVQWGICLWDRPVGDGWPSPVQVSLPGLGPDWVQAPTVNREVLWQVQMAESSQVEDLVAAVRSLAGPGDVVHALWLDRHETRPSLTGFGWAGCLDRIDRAIRRRLWGVQVERDMVTLAHDGLRVTRPPDVDWDEDDVQAIVDEHRPAGAVVRWRMVPGSRLAGLPPWAGLARKPKSEPGP